MTTGFYVRHGSMRQVGRFAAEGGAAYSRGDRVVVRSRRGDELGEVVAEVSSPAPSGCVVLRRAGAEDFDGARRAAEDRAARFAAIERFFREGRWPLEPLDVEPMLGDGRTVLLYLGPHGLDASGLLQALRDACGLDVVLEPVGLDAAEEPEAADDHGCGSCGTGGGCGDGGGCGSGSGGCDGCAVKDLVRGSRAVAAHA